MVLNDFIYLEDMIYGEKYANESDNALAKWFLKTPKTGRRTQTI